MKNILILCSHFVSSFSMASECSIITGRFGIGVYQGDIYVNAFSEVENASNFMRALIEGKACK